MKNILLMNKIAKVARIVWILLFTAVAVVWRIPLA